MSAGGPGLPHIREYPGGPPQRPYDVTAFTQGLLMGIDTVTVTEPLSVRMTRLSDVTPKAAAAPRSDASCYIVDPKLNDGFAFVNDLLQKWLQSRTSDQNHRNQRGRAPLREDSAQLLQAWVSQCQVIAALLYPSLYARRAPSL